MQPGTFTLEGDLAESWSQPNETTYVFKLRKGVRWHAKPPVNGRELTADDVKYTFERFVTRRATPTATCWPPSTRSRWSTSTPSSSPSRSRTSGSWTRSPIPAILAIVAKECVEKFGDLKKPEAVIGTGPWMLDTYRPNVGLTFVRNPSYFLAGLPYIDKVEVTVDEDNASRMAAFVAGKYDLGGASGTIDRVDWVQIKDAVKQRRPRFRPSSSRTIR